MEKSRKRRSPILLDIAFFSDLAPPKKTSQAEPILANKLTLKKERTNKKIDKEVEKEAVKEDRVPEPIEPKDEKA